jgi:hypothetical protein
LLRNMLAAHPLLAVPDESPFIRDVYEELDRGGRIHDLATAWALIRRARFFRQWGLDPAVVERLLAARPAHCYADLIRTLFAAYAESEGKPLTADKTPSHAYCFEWYAENFPESRFVHVLRDPRAVCMSLAVQPWHRDGIEGAAQMWVRTVERAREAGRMLDGRFLEIRYEDLIARPLDELERLCTFAGLPFTNEMLSYPATARLLPDRHHSKSRTLPRHGLRPWEHELDPDDIRLIELIASVPMTEAGYAPISTSAPPRIRLRSRRARLKRRARHGTSRWLHRRAFAAA